MKDESTETKDRGATAPGPEASGNLGQPSSVEEITSRIEEGKQYDGASVLKMVKDTLSADGREQKGRAEKAEAEVKRLTGDVGTLTANMNTLTGQISEFTRAKNEAEAAAVQENPEALASLRVRQANTAERIRLEGVDTTLKSGQAQLEIDRGAVKTAETSVTIKLAAMAAGVDENKLAALVPDGDPGRLALAATTIKQVGTQAFEIDPKTGQPVIDPVTKLPKPAALTNVPASVVSVGGDARSVSEKMLADAKAK